MFNILLWDVLTTILVVAINGPSYWWLPSGVVLFLYLLDLIENMAHNTLRG